MNSFDYLLQHLDREAGQKDQVALAIHFAETELDADAPTRSQIVGILEDSRSAVNPAAVSTYLARLDDGALIKPSNGSGYRLTHDGTELIRDLVDSGVLDAPRTLDERFIDSDVFEDDDYHTLVNDINESYRYHIYDGTMVLTRKLFENMVFEILRGEHAGENVQMFFDHENQRHYHFDELLNNLKLSVPDLKRFTKEGFDSEMVEEIRDLKDKGNKSAHSIRVNYEEGDVENLADDATYLAEVIYEIWTGVQDSNGSG